MEQTELYKIVEAVYDEANTAILSQMQRQVFQSSIDYAIEREAIIKKGVEAINKLNDGVKEKKIILHLCADIGSDSRFYQLDDNYEVILIGEKIGVENYEPPENVHGIIANPVCTEFSTAQDFRIKKDLSKGMLLVAHCQRIIEKAKPKWWVIENPANGRLKEFLGKPKITYQPWRYGSPWTKNTALWGQFNIPTPTYDNWEDVPKLDLYVKPNRKKPGLDCMHKSAIDLIPEFEWAREHIKCDADIRSMCSQGFAKAFYDKNP